MLRDDFSGFETGADDPADARSRNLAELAKRLGMRAVDLDVFLRAGLDVECIPKGRLNRQSMLEYLRKKATPPPKWIVISGMWPETEAGDTAELRRKKIRALHSAAVLFIRRALKRHQMDGGREERTVFWDPIVEVCRELEIAPSKLSALCKELTGNSLLQTIDAIRAEGIRRILKRAVRVFVESRRGEVEIGRKGIAKKSNAQGAGLGTDSEAWEIWNALKANRKWPEFSQNGWAQELGFASYRRFYRACQVVYRMTPHQLEMVLIRECLAESSAANGNIAETANELNEGMGLAGIDAAIRELRGFDLLAENSEETAKTIF